MTEYKGIHGEPLEPSRGSHTQGGNEEKSIDERDHTRLRYLPRVDRFSVRDKIRLGTYTNKEPWPAANMEAKVKWKKKSRPTRRSVHHRRPHGDAIALAPESDACDGPSKDGSSGNVPGDAEET